MLLEEHGLDFNAPLAEFLDLDDTYLRRCTVRHLLTHTVPYREFGSSWPFDPVPYHAELGLLERAPREAREAIMSAKADGSIRDRVVYSNIVSWQLLSEIVSVLASEPAGQCLRRMVIKPLDMTSVEFMGEAAPLDAAGGPSRPGDDPAPAEQSLLGRLEWPAWGVNLRGTVADMIRPVEAVLQASRYDDAPCGLSRRQASQMIAKQRPELPDPTLSGAEASWGLGLFIEPREFGQPQSAKVFGHTGFRASFIYANVEQDLCIGFFRTKRVSFGADMASRRRIIQAIAADLGLTR
jgi:CubicO group peptidase (beta-lactamase class C family)